jgi:hypothetical protein
MDGVNFKQVEFSDSLFFTGTSFQKKAPNFGDCSLPENTHFDDSVQFPEPTGSQENARAYRILKRAFASMGAIRDEQRFFRLEMAEETERAHTGKEGWIKKRLFGGYKHLSDYGFSVIRPLCLVLPVFIFSFLAATTSFLFEGLAGASPNWSFIYQQMSYGWLLDGFWLALPFKWDLVNSPLLMLTKLLALLGWFLIGLGVRNLLRLRS